MKTARTISIIIRTLTSHQQCVQRTELNRAVSEAEKIVGYPTSFLNLRWLLADEIANVALHLRKLIGTNHPLLSTARKLFLGSNTPAWGLILLLISKAAGLNSEFSENEKDTTAGILHSQRVLAEVVEMIRTSNLLHKSILNMNEEEHKVLKDLVFGNKISLLSGDYLLSRSFHELAFIKNQNLNELMSSALRDLMDAEFIGFSGNQNLLFPYKPVSFDRNLIIDDIFDTKPYETKQFLGNPRSEWTIRNILAGASLLGKSCQGALKLAKHTEKKQHLAYVFGKCTALAWQAQVEQEAFTSLDNLESFSLISAPVMFQLESEPKLYEKIEVGLQDTSKIDYEFLKEAVLNGDGLEKTKTLQKELCSEALTILNELPTSEARMGLENIINSMLH